MTTRLTESSLLFLESIGEKASPPTSASSSDKEDKDGDTPPPQKSDRARRRLSVKEKVAFLDKNSNEQASDQLSRRSSNLPKDPASPKVSGKTGFHFGFLLYFSTMIFMVFSFLVLGW